jgi:hypothetical protein
VPQLRVRFPVLAFNGQRATQIIVDGPTASVALDKSKQVFRIESHPDAVLTRSGQWVSSRNGYLEWVEAEVKGRQVEYSLRPQAGEPSR